MFVKIRTTRSVFSEICKNKSCKEPNYLFLYAPLYCDSVRTAHPQETDRV